MPSVLWDRNKTAFFWQLFCWLELCVHYLAIPASEMKMPFCLSGSWPCHIDVWSLLLVLVQFLQSGLELQAIPNTENLVIWYRGSLSFLRITISLLTSDVHLAPFAIFTMLLSEQWSAWNLSHSLICDRSTVAASWFTLSLWWIGNVLYFHRFECRPRNNAVFILFPLHFTQLYSTMFCLVYLQAKISI